MMATPLDIALENLSIQDVPNVNLAAKTYGVVESTLRRRWKNKTTSHQEASSLHKQRLTNVQEEVLISQIDRLTDRGLPPTAQMVKNFAEEIIQDSVGKNWTSDFVRRHKDKLKSLYLTNIDHKRKKSEYAPSFEHFYNLVNLCYVLAALL